MNTRVATKTPEAIKPTSSEAVRFRDGDMVDADALTTAMHYPVSLLRTALRSYLGCGVVCGLEVEEYKGAGDHESYTVTVRAGAMIDCHGYPVELCGDVHLDLSPDPCDYGEGEQKVCLVMRRITDDDVPPHPCGCDTDAARYQCTRLRDHALIRAVDLSELRASGDAICERVQASPDTAQGSRMDRLCACLTTCSEICCSGTSWVLLGCVTVRPRGSDGSGGISSPDIDLDVRRYVKPIECQCSQAARQIEDLETRLSRLEAGSQGG